MLIPFLKTVAVPPETLLTAVTPGQTKFNLAQHTVFSGSQGRCRWQNTRAGQRHSKTFAEYSPHLWQLLQTVSESIVVPL